MKQLDVFKKIGGILKELNDQYDYLEAESSDLNELELELFVANAHFLKDHAEILRRLHERNAPAQQTPLEVEKPKPVAEKSQPAPPPEKKQESVHEQRYFEPVVQQKPTTESKLELSPEVEPQIQAPYNPVKIESIIPVIESQEPEPLIELAAESPVDTYSFERQEPEPVQQELEVDEAEADWEDEEDQFEQEELTEQTPPAEPEEVPQAPAPTISEPVTAVTVTVETKEPEEDKVLTFNQKISAQKAAEKEKGTTTAPQVNALPITDLKSAINLNDKLLYIKDLFNGYSLAYSEAIEIANRFTSFDEAERFLKTNYVVKNNWESKPITMQKFYDLLKRRYAN